MLTYLDLENLDIRTTEDNQEIITKGTHIDLVPNSSISTFAAKIDPAVKKLLEELNSDKIYNFGIDLFGDIDDEEFESAVNVILAAFFRNIRVDKGRPRERRLDVPENLKGDVHCSLALLKNAINYRTLVDRFQLEITGRGLVYILVGGYDE